MARVLVCARADESLMVRGSQRGRKCSKCGAAVMLAPTAQRYVQQHPDMEIVCRPCGMAAIVEQAARAGVHEVQVELTAPQEEIAAEMQTVEPNLWRKRN